MTIDVRVPAGVPTGGQFAQHPRSEGDVALSAPTPDSVADTIRANPHGEHLVFVSPNETLTARQVDDLLAGNLPKLVDEVSEEMSDRRRHETFRFAAERARGAGLDYDELDDSDQAIIDDAVRDSDVSDPVGALIRNTPPYLLRLPLPHSLRERLRDTPSILSGADWGYEHRGYVLLDALDRAGVPTYRDDVRTAVRELVQHGPKFWNQDLDIQIVTYGRPGDFAAPDGDGEKRVVALEGAHLLLLDRGAGQGYAVRIPDTVRVELSRDTPAVRDAAGAGASWGTLTTENLAEYAAETKELQSA